MARPIEGKPTLRTNIGRHAFVYPGEAGTLVGMIQHSGKSVRYSRHGRWTFWARVGFSTLGLGFCLLLSLFSLYAFFVCSAKIGAWGALAEFESATHTARIMQIVSGLLLLTLQLLGGVALKSVFGLRFARRVRDWWDVDSLAIYIPSFIAITIVAVLIALRTVAR